MRFYRRRLTGPAARLSFFRESHLAVLQSTIWEVAPGRLQEVIGHAAHSKKIQERHGTKARLLQVQIAGGNSNRLAYTLLHSNMSAFGTFSAALQADAEWMAFQQTVLGSASPSARLVNHALSVEVPGFEGPFVVTGRSVSSLTQIRANPGGREGVIEQIATVKRVIEGLGGSVSVRNFQTAGEATGLIAAAVTYDDIAAYGKATDALLAHADYAAMVARMGAKDSPGVIVSRGLAVEIPI